MKFKSRKPKALTKDQMRCHHDFDHGEIKSIPPTRDVRHCEVREDDFVYYRLKSTCRRTISLPSELDERMSQIALNWSEIARRAFECALEGDDPASRNLLSPSGGELLAIQTDITKPKYGVEIEIKPGIAGQPYVVWVSVDGITILRCCQVENVQISHQLRRKPCRASGKKVRKAKGT